MNNISKNQKVKTLNIVLLFAICMLSSCAQNNSKASKNSFQDIKEILELEFDTISSTQKRYEFSNTQNDEKVSILHHLEQTGFHVYNSVNFKTEDIGVLAGGTGLRVRITENGGENWKQFRFSKFANPFHSIEFSDTSLFVVGESEYIFKSSDLGENWSVLNTNHFFELKGIVQIKYYKIRFLNNQIGFIAGEQNGHPVLLKTTNGGADWSVVKMKGIVNKEFAILDFKILSKKEIIIVTQSGKCYKSVDQGINWGLLYSSEAKYGALNSIDFKDANTGLIGGLNGNLLHTNDGGKTWNTIEIPKAAAKSNISNILFVKNQFLITTAVSYNDDERDVFVYKIPENGTTIQPFLTKTDSTVFFAGNSYGLDAIDDTVYILGRNNLYKTPLKSKE